jgi:hypothetical protein
MSNMQEKIFGVRANRKAVIDRRTLPLPASHSRSGAPMNLLFIGMTASSFDVDGSSLR